MKGRGCSLNLRSRPAEILLISSTVLAAAITGSLVASKLLPPSKSLGLLLNPAHVHLRLGDSMPKFSARDLNGNQINVQPSGKWLLVFYFDSKRDLNFLLYSRVLAERYRDSGLQIIGITDQVSDDLISVMKDDPIPYPVIADEDLSLKGLLRLNQDPSGLVFADPNGIIQFSLPHLLSPDQLRQLVERFVVGKINYDLRQQIALKPLSELPPHRIKNIKTGEETRLNKLNLKNAAIIFFTSSCSACSWDTYMNALQELELSGSPYGQNRYILFSRNFALPSLLADLKARNIASEVYIAREDIEELGSPYVTKSSPGEEVIVITTDGSGLVETIKPLTAWMRRKL